MRTILFCGTDSLPIGRPEAGTARDFPQLRIASIFSGLVCDNGTTLFNDVMSRSGVMASVGLAICR